MKIQYLIQVYGLDKGGLSKLFCWYLDTVMMVYEARFAEKNIEPPVFIYRINNNATDRLPKVEFPGHGINKKNMDRLCR